MNLNPNAVPAKAPTQPFFHVIANVLIVAAFCSLPWQGAAFYLSPRPPARSTWPTIKRLGTRPSKRKTKNPLN